jgi:hypothetical protein
MVGDTAPASAPSADIWMHQLHPLCAQASNSAHGRRAVQGVETLRAVLADDADRN